MMDPEICRVGVLVGAHLGEVGRWVLALVRRLKAQTGGAGPAGQRPLTSSWCGQNFAL